MSVTPSNPSPLAVQGAQPPVRAIYRTLRERWLESRDDSQAGLARRLGVQAQQVSQWASGSDATKHPPWWVLLAMADDLGLAVLVQADGAYLVKRRKAPAAELNAGG